MPVSDGYALMAHIREWFPNGSAPPVIAVTAFGTANDQRKVADAGFAQHMTKPIDPVTFARAVATLCGQTARDAR
jgi:two-component system CheB/CheR fusion protein